jgi:hypothetical protein
MILQNLCNDKGQFANLKVHYRHINNIFGDPSEKYTELRLKNNLVTCHTNHLGSLNLWSVLTGGHSSEVALCRENRKWPPLL